jgi:hypothetical protein
MRGRASQEDGKTCIMSIFSEEIWVFKIRKARLAGILNIWGEGGRDEYRFLVQNLKEMGHFQDLE